MKPYKYILISAVMLGLFSSSPVQGGTVLDKNGRLRDEFFAIGKILNLDWGQDIPSIHEYMQKNFLRPPGKERQSIDPSLYEDRLPDLIAPLRKLGMADPAIPPPGHYDYLVLMGQSIPMMRAQLEFVRRLENGGSISFSKIVSLTGQRPLIPSFDGTDPLFDSCRDEAEAARRLIESYFPDRLEDCCFVVCPMHRSGKRPNTRDTIVRWLQSRPSHGTILMVSNNPFIPIQMEALNGELALAEWPEKLCHVATAGNSITFTYTGNNHVAILLDTLARLLYTERHYRGEL